MSGRTKCETCCGWYASGYTRCPECVTAPTPDAVVVARTKVELAIGKCVITRMSAESVRETYDLLDAYAAAVRAECAAKVRGECVWASNENGAWETECGRTWEFIDDGPKENGMKFCHNCGKSVRALEAHP